MTLAKQSGHLKGIAYRFLGLVLVKLMFVMLSGAAQAGSCWTILKYRADGSITSETSCTDDGDHSIAPPEIEGTRSPERDPPVLFQKEVEPGEVLILDPAFGVLARARREGYALLGRVDLPGLGSSVLRLQTPTGIGVPEAIRQLRGLFSSLTIDSNDLFSLASSLENPDSPGDYARRIIGWGKVPPNCGRGLRIGMVDGAVDTTHRALKGQRVHYRKFLWPGRKQGELDHGTAVAILLVGTPGIFGTSGGLLPGADLYAAGIFERRRGRSVGNLMAFIRAINWFVRADLKLVNMSVAGSRNAVLKEMLDRAAEKGMLMVAAAGNNGDKAQPAWPAAHPRVLAVTAVDRDMSIYRWANRGTYIDFAAPGVAIDTLTPAGRKKQSGTSFAAPFITSMAALHLKAGYALDPESIRRSLRRYTHDLGDQGKDRTFGWGLVRLRPEC